MGTPPRVLFVATYPSPGMIPFAAGIINAFYEAGHETWALTVSHCADSFSKLLLPGIHLTECPEPSSTIQKIARHFRPAKAARAICDIADKNHITNIISSRANMALPCIGGRRLPASIILSIHYTIWKSTPKTRKPPSKRNSSINISTGPQCDWFA